jgi:holo-ACP synthase
MMAMRPTQTRTQAQKHVDSTACAPRAVSHSEVLASREQRAARQKQLLAGFARAGASGRQSRADAVLVCFTPVSPGPAKDSSRWRAVFELGCRAVEKTLARSGVPILHREERLLPTGPEGFFLLAAAPRRIKRLMVQVEEEHTAGRLFDLDVLDSRGTHLSRRDLGLPGRTCLVCDRPAACCGPLLAHPLPELLTAADRLLDRALAAAARHPGGMNHTENLFCMEG